MTETGIGTGNHPNSLKALKEYGFKRGQSGNPKGSPKGQGRIDVLELLKPLIRVINDQQCRIEKQGDQISEHVKKLNKAEAELTEAFELIEELNEIPDAEALKSQICENCSKDIFEQQQNYERIKEQLFRENDEMKAKIKELKFSLESCQAREKDNWSWKDDAIKLDKELRHQRKDTKFWKQCHASLQGMCETLQEELISKTQRIEILLDKLKRYQEAERQYNEAKIGMEYAGRARR